LPLWLGGAGAAPGVARADVQACVDQHAKGQELRDESHFLEARAHFLSCAEPACPNAIRVECADLLEQIDRAMPSVILVAREGGRDLAGVRVEIDGQPVEGAFTGRAIPVDPGTHQIRFMAADGRSVELEVVALETVKGRAVEANFSPAAPAPGAEGPVALAGPQMPPASEAPAVSSQPAPIVAYVLGGVGIAALAGSGYFAWSGRSQRNELADTCSPTCTEDRVDEVHTKYLVADILLGVGVVALGAGAYFYFSAPDPAQGQGWVAGVRGAF
jgi:hypothetical protein